MSATHIICVKAPVRIQSEANERHNWRTRAARFKRQKQAVYVALHAANPATYLTPPKPPATITLTRIGPRVLDDDNLAGGFKAVRDAVALWLAIDDGDTRLTWRYAQRKGKPKEYAAEIVIESTLPAGGISVQEV